MTQRRRHRPRGQVDGRRSRRAPRGARAAPASEPAYWTEVPKSKYAPERVEKALAEGAETIFVWGGDGMVQRCVDVMAGTDARLAIIPAGTANLFASNLDIPDDIDEAVEVGLARTREAARRREDQRRALRGHGRRRSRRAHDPRHRRRPEGQVRDDSRTSGRRRRISASSRSRRGSRSTATSGTTTTRAVCSSGTSERSSAGSRRSTTPRPRTASSRSA